MSLGVNQERKEKLLDEETVRWRTPSCERYGIKLCGEQTLGDDVLRRERWRHKGGSMLQNCNIETLNRRPFLILQNDIERMDDSRNVAKDCQEDVDEKVGTAATLKEDT